ncbi:MAG: sulfatase [Candidatus Nanopelagicales bacterium]
MRHRWVISALALGLVVSVAGPVRGALAPQDMPVALAADVRERPNVLLILTDDQRAGTVVGLPTVMSEIVDKGTTYPNAFVPTSWCCPSRASLLSGKFAHNSGVWENSTSSAWGAWASFAYGGEESDTLATRLDDAGYRTGLFGKYLNDTVSLGEDYKPAGWDEWDAFLGGNYTRYRLSSDTKPVRKDRTYLTDVLADRTVDFIESTPEDTPFFAYFSPFAPHYPFDAGPYAGAAREAGLLDDVREGANYPSPATNQADMSGYPTWMQKLEPTQMWNDRGRSQTPPMTIDQVIERQADTLMGVDAAVDRMLDTLRESGRLDNTLIVFMSDNGYAWGEHRLQGKNTPYDASVRVPLVMRYDGTLAAGAVDERVVAANVDVHATILDVAGVKPGQIDGVSALASDRDGLVMEAMRWAGYYGRPAYCGYRTEDRLYVRYANGQEELYDYTRDPYELDNLANDPAYAAEKDALKRQTRQACSPTPPGFAWDEQPTRLRPPSQVTATWETPKSVVVTWRAPSGVGAELPTYRVYLGREARGRAACERESVRLDKGLRCRIPVPEDRTNARVTVASVRGSEIVAAEPITLPKRPKPGPR